MQLIVGNWKMNGTRERARELAKGVAQGRVPGKAAIAVCPPFPFLEAVSRELEGSSVGLGAQNCAAPEKDGAFTGEVSAEMLASVGCRYVIVGHSERRTLYGDTDELVARKLRNALRAGLSPIVCVGEVLAEREANQHEAVVVRQTRAALSGLDAGQLARVVIAYEPVWAIGTGKVATPEQASSMHRVVRDAVAALFHAGAARELPILYGGSVKADNMTQLASMPGIDGALVGGASLEAKQFLAIAENAVKGSEQRQ